MRLPPNTACTSELRIYEHAVALRFTESGNARVLVTGLRRPGDTPYTVERRLTVLP